MANQDPTKDIPEQLQGIIADNEVAWNALKSVRETWNDKERLLIGRLSDGASRSNAKSRVTDAMLSTLAWERQMRVCSQLPSGVLYATKGGGKNPERSAALMNLVFFKYVVPHANSQFEALTKLRMSGVYASVYGAVFILYDYRIDDEYIGPDFWILPARNVMPQPGRNSINDCAWVDVSTVVNKGYVESILKRKSTTWNTASLRRLKSLVQDGATPARDDDDSKQSAVEKNRQQNGTNTSSRTARIELITRYERGDDGHWITWAPDYPQAGILRDIPNPHKSGKIPIVARYCYPLLDSIFGLGDFERGITLQKAKDSLVNLYLEAVKLSIFPPLKMDPTLLTASTVKWQAGSKWLVKNMDQAVQPMTTNPMGVQTFQGTSEFLNTALMNQFGTTDTASSLDQSGNPAFGRTPEALQMQQQRESARDNWDRYMLEQTVSELYEGMSNLLCTNQEKPITFHIHDEDLEAIKAQYEDEDDQKEVMKDLNDRTAKVTVTKSMLPDSTQFFVDANSTLKDNEDGQEEALQKIISFYIQAPQVIDQLLGSENMKFNFGQTFKQFVYNSGVSDPDDIIVDIEKQSQDGTMQQQPSMGAQQQAPQPQMPQYQDPQIAQAAQQLMEQHMAGQQSQPVGGNQ